VLQNVQAALILLFYHYNRISGARLDFSYQFRDKKETLDELGRTLVNIVNIVPGGVVVFFPSYDCEKLVCKHLETSGVFATSMKKKVIFREPKNSSDLDKVLGDFATAVGLSRGALLKHVSLHEAENSKKDIKIVNDRRNEANSNINSQQVDVPRVQVMDREFELDIVCDVIELPEDGAHGGVKIAAVAVDHQHAVQQDENCLQYNHIDHQQLDSHSNQGAHEINQRWDISDYFGFNSDSE